MNDNTRIRIKVPAHLYESVKKQLMIKEGKGSFSGGAYTETVKEKKTTESKGSSSTAPTKKEYKSPVNEKGSEETSSMEERMASLEEMVKEMYEMMKPKEEGKDKQDEYKALVNEKGEEEEEENESKDKVEEKKHNKNEWKALINEKGKKKENK